MKKFWDTFFFGRNADEREKEELQKIGNISFYVLMLILIVSAIVQAGFLNAPLQSVFGEMICMFLGAMFLIISCVVRGVGGKTWCKTTSPLKVSLITAFAAGATLVVINAIAKFEYIDKTAGYIATLIIGFLSAFIPTFILCYVVYSAVKKREKTLEKKYEEDDSK